ncbi:MAG: hypothetical protein RL266_526 [Bacteroidota bacterium]|jgi:signal transduction histidine kinase
MEQLKDFLRQLLNSEAFMPRWVCGEWSELHGWMYIISDLVIFFAYMAIPVAMFIFVRKRWNDVPFKAVFWLFIAFISLCGTTHLIDAIIFYVPLYRFNALVLLITAVVSMVTVVAIASVLPEALAYKSPLELERIVDQKTDELTSRIVELNKLTERVSRKKEQLEHFAYITSHNLRAPATNLHALTEMLETTDDPVEIERINEKIRSSADVLLSTINDVSHVVTHSSPQLDAETMSFEKVINEVLEDHASELEALEHGIDLDLKVKELTYPPDHFRNIVQNLIENAIKYRKDSGKFHLKLKTYAEDGQIIFECEDNGIGIDLTIGSEKIFNLYKRLKGNRSGKGIGLFLVRNQLETLNGSISVTSQLGKGTNFKVIFGDVNAKN